MAAEATILVASDVHGRLALLFRIAADYERTTGRKLDALLVTGDLGIFPDDTRLDTSTRKKSRESPGELGFRAFDPRVPVAQEKPSPTLQRYLDGGRAVLRANGTRPRAKLYFIGGNHEDFSYLEQCRDADGGDPPYAVDADARILWIPSGTTLELDTAAGPLVVASVSGISAEESGRDPGRYHPLALLDPAAAAAARSVEGPCDILMTHDSARDFVHAGRGAQIVDELIVALRPTVHLSGHYHSKRAPELYRLFDAGRFADVPTLGVHIDSLVPPEHGTVSPFAIGILTGTRPNADAPLTCSFAFADAAFLSRYTARSGRAI